MKTRCKIIATMVFLAVAVMSISLTGDNWHLSQVKTGKLRLLCMLNGNNHYTHIKAERVEALVDGIWLFDNGYASNCQVIENE